MKKVIGLIILLVCFSCKENKSLSNIESQSKTEYFISDNKSVLLSKRGNNIIVFCKPINIGKYGCVLSFGGVLKENSFTKGFFLENSVHENILFDTIRSNNVSFKVEDNNLITLCKMPQIGCEVIFNNSINYNKNDTIKLQRIDKNILGIALPIKVGKIKTKLQMTLMMLRVLF
ncbi:hypothetical protein [Chryseobacterium oryctis]|uniref:Lipoprotein n=1 Tax=Chryseobacterium oryctis TaxID=2952618 RepID=A0ABT3HL71_9FLAO|nr:hypothetical protein [Chryseobacterium oryctis]MCW3160526.1 hypothetical protein [Chryseobacterium oryctis]